MDFALLPPEVNSARMYAGPGSGPMLAAAAAWDVLANELHATAGGFQSVLATLAGGPWLGPSSAAMAAAAAPYVAWLRTAATVAEQTAGQAKAAAVAYETAFAETVPPPVVLANRSLLTLLLATNFFGQNTPAISVTEAQYAEMWGQDTAAMQSYASASAAATTLTPFAEAPASTNADGLPQQAAAVAAAAGTSAGDVESTVSTVQQTLSAVPTALANLAAPAATETLSPLDLLDIFDVEVGVAGVLADTILATYSLPYSVAGFHVGVHTDDIVSGWAGVAGWPGLEPMPPSQFSIINNLGPSVSAGLGQANTIGAVSVPPGWTTSAPAVRLAATATTPAAAAAAAEASGSGAGSLFSQMALAGMAGRAMAGTAATGGPRTRERIGLTTRATESKNPAEPPQTPEPPQLPPGGPITSIAAELRELASLRDAGILTDQEFTEQKRRLLAH